MLLYGGPVTRLSVSRRQKLGLRYVTDDRLGEGIVGGLPVGLNLFLKRVGEPPFWRYGRIQRAGVDVRSPSTEGLKLAVEYLAEAESAFRNAEDVEASKLKRLTWIKAVA